MMPPGAPRASDASAAEAFTSLIGQSGAVSADEAEVRELLRRTTAIPFPTRLGVLFYNYEPPLPEDERAALLLQFGREAVATNLVRSSVPVPSEFARGASLDGLRKLAGRLQIDLLLMVGGKSEFSRSETQPGGWFASFSHAANYEARSSLLAFAMDVYSGTLLQPVTGLGKTSPTLLDPTVEGFSTQQRRLQGDAFKTAADAMKSAFFDSLRATQQAQAAVAGADITRPAVVPSVVPSLQPTASPAVRP